MTKKKRTEDQRGALQKLFDRFTLSWRLMMDGRVGLGNKIIPPLALLYLLSPIDFIPDIFLPFGVVDDIGVVILALEFFIRTAPSEVVREHLKDLRNRVVNHADDVNSDYGGDVVEGTYSIRDR